MIAYTQKYLQVITASIQCITFCLLPGVFFFFPHFARHWIEVLARCILRGSEKFTAFANRRFLQRLRAHGDTRDANENRKLERCPTHRVKLVYSRLTSLTLGQLRVFLERSIPTPTHVIIKVCGHLGERIDLGTICIAFQTPQHIKIK